MPSLSDLPGFIPKKKFIKALQKNGFVISTRGGKGGHFKAIYRNEKSITLPSSGFCKNQLKYILGEIEIITKSEITWEDIKDKL